MTEKDIQKKVLKYLRDSDTGYFFKFHNGPYGSRGVSDIIGVCNGIAVFMEVKTDKGKTTKLQEKFLRDVGDNGAIAGVVRSVDDAKALVTRAKIVSSVLGLS